MQVKLKDGSLRFVIPRIADTHRALMAVSEMNNMGHDVFFPRSDRGFKSYANHESSGTKLELESERSVRVASRNCPIQPEYISKNSTSGSYFSLSVLEQIKDMMVRAATVNHPN